MWSIGIDVVVRDAEIDGVRELAIASYREFRKDGAVRTPNISAALASGVISFVGVSDYADREKAIRTFFGAARCALHGAGAHTAGWEARVDELMAAIADAEPQAEPIPV